MADEVLPSEEIDARLREQPGWAVVDGALHREVEFADFREAFGFMAMVALAAEKLDHHPDWANSWNRVVLDISSHAAGGITERCFELVAAVDKALGE
jgi:4a-hydroxytetrahydrobiopterin dehydratase